MNPIEKKATIDTELTLRSDGGLPTGIDSLTHLESYYQSRYEYYLAMATEAKENRERVRLLLLDLDRDALASFGSTEPLHSAKDIESMAEEQYRDRAFAPDKRVNFELPQTDSPEEESEIASVEESPVSSISQMKQWTLSLAKAMLIVESVCNSDSGKTLHQNYLHHVIERELEQKLSPELIELYLEEAIRRGYLEQDEFNNNCYRGTNNSDEASYSQKPLSIEPLDSNAKSDRSLKSQLNKGTNKTSHKQSSTKQEKLYDLPESDKLRSTLCETIEEYIALNNAKRFSIDDVINYLYSEDTQLNWDKALRNKVRSSISNVLSRKTYLNKRWTRVKLGVYQPLTKAQS